MSGGLLTPTEQLIHNEQVKLTATYSNGLAIALFAVGGLAPVFSAFYSSTPAPVHLGLIAASSGVCFFGSIAIHFLARAGLKELSA